MESQQIVDYIRQNLQAGHPEANIKNHMLANGWTQPKVDEVFKHYHSLTAPTPKAKKAKTSLIKRKPQQRPNLRKRARAAWAKMVIVTVVLAAAVLAVVGHAVFENHQHHPKLIVRPKQTIAQKQMGDIINIAGAIDQYAIVNSVQPNIAVATPDGGLRLCATRCDPTAAEVSPLTTYVPADIHFATYVPGLGVPDSSAMYIVPGAACKGKPASASQSTNPHSMVILYAVLDASGLEQRCAQL